MDLGRNALWLPISPGGQKALPGPIDLGSQLHIRRSNHPKAGILEGHAWVLGGPVGVGGAHLTIAMWDHVGPSLMGTAEPFPNSWPVKQWAKAKLYISVSTYLVQGWHHSTGNQNNYPPFYEWRHWTSQISGTCPTSQNFKLPFFFFFFCQICPSLRPGTWLYCNAFLISQGIGGGNPITLRM